MPSLAATLADFDLRRGPLGPPPQAPPPRSRGDPARAVDYQYLPIAGQLPPPLSLAERNSVLGAEPSAARESVTPGRAHSRPSTQPSGSRLLGQPSLSVTFDETVGKGDGPKIGGGRAAKPPQPEAQAKTDDKDRTPKRGPHPLAGQTSGNTTWSDTQSEESLVHHFDHLLSFPEEMVPVYETLHDEQEERRLLDHVRNREATRYLERLNEELDVAQRERQESDILLDKINNTRLDALQKKLVRQINKGFEELHAQLDDAKERMRVNTEKLHQLEVDAEIERKKLMVHFHEQMDSVTDMLEALSKLRVREDEAFRATIPQPILERWRELADETDIVMGQSRANAERLLPLEHPELNDIEQSVAQKTIRRDLGQLLADIQQEVEDRINEEKAQAARARALTDALAKGLRIMNSSAILPSPYQPPPAPSNSSPPPADDA